MDVLEVQRVHFCARSEHKKIGSQGDHIDKMVWQKNGFNSCEMVGTKDNGSIGNIFPKEPGSNI